MEHDTGSPGFHPSESRQRGAYTSEERTDGKENPLRPCTRRFRSLERACEQRSALRLRLGVGYTSIPSCVGHLPLSHASFRTA